MLYVLMFMYITGLLGTVCFDVCVHYWLTACFDVCVHYSLTGHFVF